MRKKITLIFTILSLLTLNLGAFQPSDLSDPVYQDLKSWEDRGLIRPLPVLKPYPLQVITGALREAESKGNENDKVRAQSYLQTISASLQPRALQIFSDSALTKGDLISVNGGYFHFNSLLGEVFSASGFFGALLMDRGDQATGESSILQPGEHIPYNYIVDDSAFTVGPRTLLMTLSMGGLFSWGDENLWVQTGYHRSSFGPFSQGVVISDELPASTSLQFNWRGDFFSYTKYFYALSATKDRETYVRSFQDYFPNKYLSGQVFYFRPFDWLEAGLFESVVFGQRIEPIYLLPGISSLYTSIYTGMHDNILVGFLGSVKLPGNLKWDLVWHGDDLHFLKLLTFDTSGKTKIGVQTGLTWTPGLTFLNSLSLDYSLVTPYTFTHAAYSIDGEDTEINYVNYTHMGYGISFLEPNSDRIRAEWQMKPAPQWDVTLQGSFRRHGNASDSFEEYTGERASKTSGTSDGGFNDNGYISSGNHRYETNVFLSQDVIETLAEAKISARWTQGFDGWSLSVSGSVGAEYGWNRRTGEVTKVTVTDDQDTVELTDDINYSWKNYGSPVKGNDGILPQASLKISFSF